jgi:hypothetical protein
MMNWLNEIVTPYRELINTASTFAIAIFTIVLAYVAYRQSRDARILQRAYLDAKFGGVQTNNAGDLVGHVTFKNVGHLPAKSVFWLVNLNGGSADWKPEKIRSKDMIGASVLPIGAEWPRGSPSLPHPQENQKGLYIYVWGRVTYRDGFKRWRKRRLDFCHRYPWEKRETPTGGGVKISTEWARYHDVGNNAN